MKFAEFRFRFSVESMYFKINNLHLLPLYIISMHSIQNMQNNKKNC